MPSRANPASDEMRVAEPSSREIQVNFSRLSRDGRRGTSADLPTIDDFVLQQGFGFDLRCRDRPRHETELGAMRPKQFDRLLGRSHLQCDAHSWMGMLELGDDLRQQICAGERRRHDRHRTRAALAELGGAEARLHQEGLGPKHVVRNEITGSS